MTRIALGRSDVVVGVDTHKDEHLAVAVDGLGGRLAELAIAASPDGYARLLAWADGLGAVAVFGVEGTGSYGSGLARFLRRHGRKVIEVSRPPRKGERPSGRQERRGRCRARCSGGAGRQRHGRAETRRGHRRSDPAGQDRP